MSNRFSTSQVAKMAGITNRTLHHYDAIGLLKPAIRTEKGYRYYVQADLLRLQQIMFYRELNFPLEQIKHILDDPNFDLVAALHNHYQHLSSQKKQLEKLLTTIDKTIATLTKDNMPMNEEELYKGFSKEKIERWNKEVDKKYDPELVAQSRAKLKNTSKQEWRHYKEEIEALNQALAAAMDQDIDSPQVQELIKRHHAGIEFFYKANAQVYAGLGQLYIQNPEFTAYYEKYRPGLAHFICDAMHYFAEHTL